MLFLFLFWFDLDLAETYPQKLQDELLDLIQKYWQTLFQKRKVTEKSLSGLGMSTTNLLYVKKGFLYIIRYFCNQKEGKDCYLKSHSHEYVGRFFSFICMFLSFFLPPRD